MGVGAMAKNTDPRRGQLLELAGDGGVVTAALSAVCVVLAFIITGGLGSKQPSAASELASAALMLLAGAGGPIAAWYLHKRRFTVPAVLGMAVGVGAAGAVFFLFVGISQGLDWLLSPITGVKYIGPLIAAALVAADFAFLVGWLAFNAIRDLRGAQARRGIDLARLVAVGVIVAYSGTVVGFVLTGTDAEMLEAIAFMMLAAVAGASMVTFAELATRLNTPVQAPPAT